MKRVLPETDLEKEPVLRQIPMSQDIGVLFSKPLDKCKQAGRIQPRSQAQAESEAP
jgi:hypothetical protein